MCKFINSGGFLGSWVTCLVCIAMNVNLSVVVSPLLVAPTRPPCLLYAPIYVRKKGISYYYNSRTYRYIRWRVSLICQLNQKVMRIALNGFISIQTHDVMGNMTLHTNNKPTVEEVNLHSLTSGSMFRRTLKHFIIHYWKEYFSPDCTQNLQRPILAACHKPNRKPF